MRRREKLYLPLQPITQQTTNCLMLTHLRTSFMDLNSTMATVRTSSYYKSNGSSESIPDPSFDPQSECAQDEIDAENIAFAQEIRSRTTIDSSIPFLPLERTDSNRSTQLELPQVCHDAPSPITSSNRSILSRYWPSFATIPTRMSNGVELRRMLEHGLGILYRCRRFKEY